jgi:hypothetical protein
MVGVRLMVGVGVMVGVRVSVGVCVNVAEGVIVKVGVIVCVGEIVKVFDGVLVAVWVGDGMSTLPMAKTPQHNTLNPNSNRMGIANLGRLKLENLTI